MIPAKINASTTAQTFLSLFYSTLFLLFLTSSAYGFDLYIGTDKEGSLSHFTGSNICRIIQLNDANIQCRIVESESSSVNNLTNLQTGALDLALVDSGILFDAVNKTGAFKFNDIPFENISYLVPLYKKHISLLVRKGAHIATLDDLNGKRVNIGSPGTDQFRISKTIFEVKKWTKSNFAQLEQLPSSQAQDYLAFNLGSVQAMFHVGVHPDTDLANFIGNKKSALINMNDAEMDIFVENNPGYFYIHIPARTYPGQNNIIATYGTEISLLTNSDLDNELILSILNALFKEQDYLRKSHSALSLFNLEKNVLVKPVVNYHPSVELFFSQ